MTEKRRFSVVLPADSEWTVEELNDRAEGMGMSRNEFIVKAIDMLMNFDDVFLDEVKKYSQGLKIPEYMVIQNVWLKRIAEEQGTAAAYEEAGWNQPINILDEFIQVTDSKGTRTLTGQELLNVLKDKEYRETKQDIKATQDKRKSLGIE